MSQATRGPVTPGLVCCFTGGAELGRSEMPAHPPNLSVVPGGAQCRGTRSAKPNPTVERAELCSGSPAQAEAIARV